MFHAGANNTLVKDEDYHGTDLIERTDLAKIQHVLDQKVYVDEVVKKRLLEYFATRKFNKAKADLILCLLAPPGMGKTSVIKSLCAALSWRLIRIPIGEIRDNSGEIIGNRRSDLNAMAGRIIHALKNAMDSEVVVLLEDIDKTDLTPSGNTSVGFFEIVDYMQDYSIRNNYLKERIDFSKITFVATASNMSTIPQGIRDAMEIVTIPAYSELEKLKIACNYLIPKLAGDYGLVDRLILSKNALIEIIRGYTRESGVSELGKNLKAICQQVMNKTVGMKDSGKIIVSKRNVSTYLGPAIFSKYCGRSNDEVGVITVLGRSDKGGCLLTLESLIMKGEGKLIFTGNLDKLFQESAYVALNYIRSCSKVFGIEEDFYKKYDMHIHMSEGQTPKFGVSAGIALVTILISSLTNKKIRRDIGMTGEITLHGKVLRIRDIRDKVLAAYQGGINTIFVPAGNVTDLKYVPGEIRRKIEFIPVERVDQVIEKAFV